jgi:hypothetical protein
VPEIGTLGLMSGDGKRGVGHWPQATAPILDSTVATGIRRTLSELSYARPSALAQAPDPAYTKADLCANAIGNDPCVVGHVRCVEYSDGADHPSLR